MPDPDKSSASSSFTYGSTFAFAVFVALMIIVIYGQYKYIGSFLNMIIWGILPVIIFLIGIGLNLIGQKISCSSVKVDSAFKASWPLPLFYFGALGLSQISYLRAPITSLFVQLPNVTVLDSEARYPTLKGVAVAYYVFFGILFGQVISSGMSQVCA